jgi:hypothetical protein
VALAHPTVRSGAFAGVLADLPRKDHWRLGQLDAEPLSYGAMPAACCPDSFAGLPVVELEPPTLGLSD